MYSHPFHRRGSLVFASWSFKTIVSNFSICFAMEQLSSVLFAFEWDLNILLQNQYSHKICIYVYFHISSFTVNLHAISEHRMAETSFVVDMFSSLFFHVACIQIIVIHLHVSARFLILAALRSAWRFRLSSHLSDLRNVNYLTTFSFSFPRKQFSFFICACIYAAY